MREYSVIVTKPAADDAVEIIRYISDNLKNRKAAERHLELYLDTLRSLREMPNIISADYAYWEQMMRKR